MSSGRFQAKSANFGGRKSGKWYASSKHFLSKSAVANFCKLGSYVQLADFTKSSNWLGGGGGKFLQAHIGNLANCPVADFTKSANQG